MVGFGGSELRGCFFVGILFVRGYCGYSYLREREREGREKRERRERGREKREREGMRYFNLVSVQADELSSERERLALVMGNELCSEELKISEKKPTQVISSINLAWSSPV